MICCRGDDILWSEDIISKYPQSLHLRFLQCTITISFLKHCYCLWGRFQKQNTKFDICALFSECHFEFRRHYTCITETNCSYCCEKENGVATEPVVWRHRYFQILIMHYSAYSHYFMRDMIILETFEAALYMICSSVSDYISGLVLWLVCTEQDS